MRNSGVHKGKLKLVQLSGILMWKLRSLQVHHSWCLSGQLMISLEDAINTMWST